MSAFDVISNHKVCNMRTHAEQSIGAADQLVINLQEELTNGQRERSTDLLLLVFVTANAGSLTLVAKDSNDGTTYDTDFATMSAITETGIFMAHLKYVRNYVRLGATVAGGAVSWGALAVGFNALRKPVKQTDADALTITYGAGR